MGSVLRKAPLLPLALALVLGCQRSTDLGFPDGTDTDTTTETGSDADSDSDADADTDADADGGDKDAAPPDGGPD